MYPSLASGRTGTSVIGQLTSRDQRPIEVDKYPGAIRSRHAPSRCAGIGRDWCPRWSATDPM